MTQFIYTVGDWSQDGHNQYDKFVIETSFDFNQVQEANKRLFNAFPQFYRWFEDYEDSSIDEEDYEALVAIDADFVKYFEFNDDEYHFEGGPDEYVRLWIDLVTHFTPHIDLKVVRPPTQNTIHGGGYGLYWS